MVEANGNNTGIAQKIGAFLEDNPIGSVFDADEDKT